jgi:hypothetical protein
VEWNKILVPFGKERTSYKPAVLDAAGTYGRESRVSYVEVGIITVVET